VADLPGGKLRRQGKCEHDGQEKSNRAPASHQD